MELLNNPYALAGTAALAGLIVGWILSYLITNRTRVRLEAELAAKDAQIKSEETLRAEHDAALAAVRESLTAQFGQLAADTLAKSNENF